MIPQQNHVYTDAPADAEDLCTNTLIQTKLPCNKVLFRTGKTTAAEAMGYLSEGQLVAMAFDHKYASSGCSILDGLIMQKFWNYIVTFLPLKHDAKAAFHWY